MDWKSITISGTKETYLISIINESNGKFICQLTDFKVLWREKIDWKEILLRVKSQNPFMDVDGDESAIKETIFSEAKQYLYSQEENGLLINTKYYKGGVPFHFRWELTRSSTDEFYQEITTKLLVTLLNMQGQRDELIDIVKRKDAEINQYKIEGATLKRKHIETQPFVKSEFDCKFEMASDTGLFDGEVNCNAIKDMCNYSKFIRNVSANTLNVNEGPSPSKIIKAYKNKEENAMRKFKSKKECKIEYEDSFELLTADEPTEQDIHLKSDVQTDAITVNTTDQTKELPKKRLKTKLNL